MKKSTFELLAVFSGLAAVMTGLYYLEGYRVTTSTNYHRVPSEFSTLGAALRMYQVNVGRFPETEQGLYALVERPDGMPDDQAWAKLMDRVPLDPWQTEYRYADRSKEGVANSFELRSAGPDCVFDTEDDISSLQDLAGVFDR